MAHKKRGRGPGRGCILADSSVVEEVYLRMWEEHGKGPQAGQQGGNQWTLKTDSLSQVLGRAQEPAWVCVSWWCEAAVG